MLAGSVRNQSLICSGCCIDPELIGFGLDLRSDLDLSSHLPGFCNGANEIPTNVRGGSDQRGVSRRGSPEGGVAPAPDFTSALTPDFRVPY
jgi:hypothetical protein